MKRQGLILDYEIFRESAPADSQLLFQSLTRVWGVTGRHVGAVVTDRGFASAANSRRLEESVINRHIPEMPTFGTGSG